MVLDTHLPAVTQVTDATWRVELLDGDTVVSFQDARGGSSPRRRSRPRQD